MNHKLKDRVTIAVHLTSVKASLYENRRKWLVCAVILSSRGRRLCPGRGVFLVECRTRIELERMLRPIPNQLFPPALLVISRRPRCQE